MGLMKDKFNIATSPRKDVTRERDRWRPKKDSLFIGLFKVMIRALVPSLAGIWEGKSKISGSLLLVL